jgi:hypothetical protein
MIGVMAVRQQIANHWHYRNPPTDALFASDDAFAAFYTSKYLIQDTAEAVWTHMNKGFSSDPMAAYIEFWGVMQAIFIQQDAICELYEAIFGERPEIPRKSSWFELRDLRNRCAGHPAKNENSIKGSKLRSFMGRSFGSYERITYEQYDSAKGQPANPTVNLQSLIGSHDEQAAGVLSAALAEMKRKYP